MYDLNVISFKEVASLLTIEIPGPEPPEMTELVIRRKPCSGPGDSSYDTLEPPREANLRIRQAARVHKGSNGVIVVSAG